MRRRPLLLGAAASALVPASVWSAAPAPGTAVSWPEVTLLDGGRFGPRDAADHAMVVVFWSITCPFCRRHNPHVEKLHRLARGRALKVLTVSMDRDAEAVRRHAVQHGYTFPITLEHATMAERLASRRIIPLTVTVTRRGLLDKTYPGEMFEDDVLELIKLAT